MLTNAELARIRDMNLPGFRTRTIPILYPVAAGGQGLDQALGEVYHQVDQAIEEGYTYIILSDRGVDADTGAHPGAVGRPPVSTTT